MENIYIKRLEGLKKSLAIHEVDTFLVLVAENRRYLSGFTGEDPQFDESAGALIISGSRKILATDSRFILQAETEAPFFEIYCYKEGLAQALPEILLDLKTRRMGFESARTSLLLYQKLMEALHAAQMGIALIGTEDVVETLRVKKEEAEIDSLCKALGIAETVYGNTVAVLQAGMTEKEVAWMMEKGLREAGADSLSFPTIVAAGPASALPHAIPGDRPIQSGEPLLIDWGARLNGYCSDITRTAFIGPPDDRFQKVYQTVRDAQQMAIDAVKPGLSTKKIDAIARAHIEKMGFGAYFGHGLGHGTGLAVHEAPRLSPIKDVRLEPQMVFTVEPGVYIPDWGGVRIENMVVVREDGAEVLNSLATDLQILKI